MVQNDPRARGSTTIKRKNRGKYFWGRFRYFCPFLVVVGPFWRVQNRTYGIISDRKLRDGLLEGVHICKVGSNVGADLAPVVFLLTPSFLPLDPKRQSRFGARSV